MFHLDTCYHLVSYGGCFFVTKVGLIMILFNAKHFSHSIKFIFSYLSSASLQLSHFIPVSLFSLSAESLLWDIVLLIPCSPDTLHSSLIALMGHSCYLLSSAASQVGVCTQKSVWGDHSLVNIFISFFGCIGSYMWQAGSLVAAGGI